MLDDFTLTDYTFSEIENNLFAIKQCILRDRFKLALGEKREANQEFILNFNLNRERQRQLLLEVRTDDFCHGLMNERYGHEHEDLLVFMPKMILRNCFGEKKQITLYLKMNLVTTAKTPITIIISMHEALYEPLYCFPERRRLVQ
jgi:hypothetical protein